MSSSYGSNWTRVAAHKPFIPLGDATAFDSHTCFASNALLSEQLSQPHHLLPQQQQQQQQQQQHQQHQFEQEQEALLFPALETARIYYAGGNGPHSGGVSGRSNCIGLVSSPVHALAGITRRLDWPISEDKMVGVITRTITVPRNHDWNNATRLWLLLSWDRAKAVSSIWSAGAAVRVGLLPKSVSPDVDTDQPELPGAGMHQSKLRPWASAMSRERC